jgi:hypothetical protein
MLDMQPAGDGTPGNVSVDVLNITDGILANFATLSAKAINLLGVNTEFDVNPGQAIAPSGVGTVGPLTVGGLLILSGDTLMDISKLDTTLTADLVTGTGGVDLGGTLKVTFSGNTALAAGDRFTLFNAAPFNSAAIIKLPPPGSGLAWANNIFIDGSIEVIACGCGEPTTPPTITLRTTPTTLLLSWPLPYTSFALRGQTNSLTIGLSTNWGLVPGVVGNQITLPRTSANRGAFFQLFQQ